MRAVAGRPTTLTTVVADALGNAAQADTGTDVTVDVADGAGVAVVTGQVAHDDDPVGQYSYTLDPQGSLDDFAVTWHATVGGYDQVMADTLRLVGNRILSPADIAADDLLSALDARTRAQVLDGVEDLFADALGFPPVTEGVRVNFDARRGSFSEGFAYGNAQGPVLASSPATGSGGERLIVPGVALPQRVFSLSVNGNAADDAVLAQLKPGMGFLVWSGGRSWPSGNYDMWLSHGLPFVPGDLRDAAAAFATYKARRAKVAGMKGSLLPERTASLTTEGSVITFSFPSADRPTGIPDIDSVIQRYRIQSVV